MEGHDPIPRDYKTYYYHYVKDSVVLCITVWREDSCEGILLEWKETM